MRLVSIYLKKYHLTNLVSKSGFQSGDSYINEILSITYDIYKSFDYDYQFRGVSLNISKDIDKFWHNGIIFKLEKMHIWQFT